MVDLNPSNEKLVIRAKNMIKEVVGCDDETCDQLFEDSKHNVKLAICMGLTGHSVEECIQSLTDNNGHLHLAIKSLNN
jgi:N-acetylmuramic acid 6-phosphate etherase